MAARSFMGRRKAINAGIRGQTKPRAPRIPRTEQGKGGGRGFRQKKMEHCKGGGDNPFQTGTREKKTLYSEEKKDSEHSVRYQRKKAQKKKGYGKTTSDAEGGKAVLLQITLGKKLVYFTLKGQAKKGPLSRCKKEKRKGGLLLQLREGSLITFWRGTRPPFTWNKEGKGKDG